MILNFGERSIRRLFLKYFVQPAKKHGPIFNKTRPCPLFFQKRLMLAFNQCRVRGLALSYPINKARHRCCFAREFPGECLTSVASIVRPRPLSSQGFKYLEPKAISFFKKEEPHGFKTVCRGIAVFSNPRRIN